MDVLYIVVPAYNEEQNIENLVKDWYPVVQEHDGNGASRLVVINDGSKDHTYQKLQELAQTRPLLMPLTKQNGGHGATVLHGYRYALEQGADYVFQTDSDGQTNPAEFPQFWEARENYEAQFGNRTSRGDGAGRYFIEKVLCLVLKAIFHVSVPDANAPFRLMTSDYVKQYLPKMPKDFNLPNVMLSMYGVHDKRKVRFIEISFKPRQAGTNSINVRKIVKIGWQAVKDFYQIKKNM